METKAKKWGGALAIRVPQGIAGEVGIIEDGSLEIAVPNGAVSAVNKMQKPCTLHMAVHYPCDPQRCSA